jgi:hypothetical protein
LTSVVGAALLLGTHRRAGKRGAEEGGKHPHGSNAHSSSYQAETPDDAPTV